MDQLAVEELDMLLRPLLATSHVSVHPGSRGLTYDIKSATVNNILQTSKSLRHCARQLFQKESGLVRVDYFGPVDMSPAGVVPVMAVRPIAETAFSPVISCEIRIAQPDTYRPTPCGRRVITSAECFVTYLQWLESRLVYGVTHHSAWRIRQPTAPDTITVHEMDMDSQHVPRIMNTMARLCGKIDSTAVYSGPYSLHLRAAELFMDAPSMSIWMQRAGQLFSARKMRFFRLKEVRDKWSKWYEALLRSKFEVDAGTPYLTGYMDFDEDWKMESAALLQDMCAFVQTSKVLTTGIVDESAKLELRNLMLATVVNFVRISHGSTSTLGERYDINDHQTMFMAYWPVKCPHDSVCVCTITQAIGLDVTKGQPPPKKFVSRLLWFQARHIYLLVHHSAGDNAQQSGMAHTIGELKQLLAQVKSEQMASQEGQCADIQRSLENLQYLVGIDISWATYSEKSGLYWSVSISSLGLAFKELDMVTVEGYVERKSSACDVVVSGGFSGFSETDFLLESS